MMAEHNHNALLCPGWASKAGCLEAPKSFGAAPLQPEELAAKVSKLKIEPSLMCEQKCLAKKQGSALPFAPVRR